MGILADGYVDSSEVEFLLDWLEARPHLLEDPVVNEMVSIILNAMEGGIEGDGQGAILEALLSFTGSPNPSKPHSSAPSELPLCEKIPKAELNGDGFLLYWYV